MTPGRPGRAQVVVFGSRGTAGTGAVHACLAEPGVSEVRAVTRRPLGVSHDKLKDVPWSDFADLGGLAQQLQPTGTNRWLLAPLLRVIPALGITSFDLGRAMLRIGLDRSWHGSRTLENRDLKALLREGQPRGL